MGFARKSDAFGVLVLPFGKIIFPQMGSAVKRFGSSTFPVWEICTKKPLNACFY